MKPTRALVSWIAWHYDFKDKTGPIPNPDGPTFDLHRRFFDPKQHDIHVLISSAPDRDERTLRLYSELKQVFPRHHIVLRFKSLADIFDFQEIKLRAEEVLAELARYEAIDIIVSNGTTPMRTVWLALHLEDNGYRTHLIQGLDREMSASGRSEFIRLRVDASLFAYRILIREAGRKPDSGLYRTPKLQSVYDLAAQIAASDYPCLIEGASGTGKENLAKEIHLQSARRDKAFVPVNCGTFTNPELLASELFGYVKGAFTGADKDHQGIFERASGGTLFLDEIGDISPQMQVSLLRALQEQKIRPINSYQEVPVNVRIIAATNKNLLAECKAGRFRWDLYYRLAVAQLHVPSFADYPISEKQTYIRRMLGHEAERLKCKPLTLSAEAEEKLLLYPFPGNFRELENVIRKLYLFAAPAQREIQAADLPGDLREALPQDQTLRAFTRHYARQVLARHNGNQRQAARTLDISLNSLKKYVGEQ
ncbi:MAG: sigma-54 dependent transcriptional regulator [Bacteroidia bacterium]|nr:sigma-54 dependent transcriptional regulator [Bacteroidia bacterium]